MTNTNITDAIINFVSICQEAKDNYFAVNYKNLKPSLFKIYKGRKFAKVTTTSDGGLGQECVFCFIDKSNGMIYKPAGYNSRAKHARGNVLSVKSGRESLDYSQQHIRYLK